MKRVDSIDSYIRFYTDMNFDRAGLFDLIRSKYGCSTVLYPGCSIHITPSFYFQHVVYVDISEESREFFRDTQNIVNFVNCNKKYKQSAYIEFIDNDYTKQLPVRENNYDLLLAIYAAGIAKACKNYIKPGGIIVSNNHHGDAEEVLEDKTVTLEALIRKKGDKYQVEEATNEKMYKTLKEYSIPLKNMKRSSKGMEYVDKDCYFVLRKAY